MPQVLRTADDRFADLPDFPFQPHYSSIDHAGTPLRIHHVDEGPAEGTVVLLLHGEPTWAYLYRHMIRGLVELGFRAVVPDLVGFGRSDKLPARSDYTYERHVRWMSDWLVARELEEITLFCQDWGGLIGLRLVAAIPERFARVVASNTILPLGHDPGEGFRRWLAFSQDRPMMHCGGVVQGGSKRDLSPAEVAAYDAPFPDESYKAGPHVFPTLVPISPDHPSVEENRRAAKALAEFDRPFLTVFGEEDPVLGHVDTVLQKMVAGAAGQPHRRIADAGHFIQEDAPDELVDIIAKFAAG
ncbi:MAG: haloalkane dehalogenase [Xanthomonadales bacterium]|nr:haloalkane dehalogenase [Xanthomonadales bacterium]